MIEDAIVSIQIHIVSCYGKNGSGMTNIEKERGRCYITWNVVGFEGSCPKDFRLKEGQRSSGINRRTACRFASINGVSDGRRSSVQIENGSIEWCCVDTWVVIEQGRNGIT